MLENMAEARQTMLTGEAGNPVKKMRKSYSREEKLKVVGTTTMRVKIFTKRVSGSL